ncbi:MAG: Uma2 family endonuclease [Candidatus Magnetomorum sp.]|nr:Uma2 family endonuclease [Candidatus Magnetomorum sp.]
MPEDVYWDLYYEDTLYEWNNGKLEVKPVSDCNGCALERFFNQLLNEYMSVEKNVQAISSEIGFRMAIRSGIKIRKPDLALIAENSLKMKGSDCTYKGIFDICIEFLSDSRKSEIERDTIRKKKEYEQAGVKEYFILDRKGKHTHFFRLKNGKYQPIKPVDGVIKSEVLKNFQFRIEDLYSRPEMSELKNDPIYKNYVKVDLQKSEKKVHNEKKRAENEKKKAEQEKKRAENEKKKAEREKKRAENEKKRVDNEKKRADNEKKKAEQEKKRAENEKKKAEQEKKRAENEKKRAEREKKRADNEKKRADNAERHALALEKKLAELGITLD